MPITGSDREFAVVGRGTVFDGIAYWVTLAGVYLMVGGLMFYSGKGKLFDSNGNAPQGIKDQFKGTFLDTFPGVDTAWFILGVLEFGVFVLLLASLIRLEFLTSPRQVDPAGGACTGAADFCVSGVRSDRDEPVLRDSRALHVLRLHSGHLDPGEPHASKPFRQMARRCEPGEQLRRIGVSHPGPGGCIGRPSSAEDDRPQERVLHRSTHGPTPPMRSTVMCMTLPGGGLSIGGTSRRGRGTRRRAAAIAQPRRPQRATRVRERRGTPSAREGGSPCPRSRARPADHARCFSACAGLPTSDRRRSRRRRALPRRTTPVVNRRNST